MTHTTLPSWRPREPELIALAYCHGLAVNTVVLPLLAVSAGFHAGVIGLMVGLSGLGQIGVRQVVMRLTHRLGERSLIVLAVALLILSGLVVLVSTAAVAFCLAHLIQGASRGAFWIGLQSHVVRVQDDPKRSLATIDFLGGIGLTLGPLTIGAASGSLNVALAVGMLTASLVLLPLSRLSRLALTAVTESRRVTSIWRRPGAAPAVFAAMSTGIWRGLLGTYIPVFLNQTGYSTSVAGAFVAIGSACSIAGSLLVGVLRRRQIPVAYFTSGLVIGSSLIVIGLAAEQAWLVAVAMVASGIGAGALQTISSVRAAYVAEMSERGRVVAQVGNYRAIALLVAPLGIAGLVTWLPLGVAIAVMGTLSGAPAAVRWTARPGRGDE